MKKLFLGAVAAVVCASAVTFYTSVTESSKLQNLFANAEALADNESPTEGESGGGLVCRCQPGSARSCTVDNEGATCATGSNVCCWEYSLNCSGNI